MNEKDNFALVPRPLGTIKKPEPGARRILSGMVADTLALAQGKTQVRSPSALQPFASADLESWYQKGEDYHFGRGVPQDYAQAIHWYRKFVEQGGAPALNNLGDRYRNGWGVAKDAEEAVNWYRKAAEQWDAPAQFKLGYCYENGQGVRQDFSEAVKCYRKAAEQGHTSAQKNFGACYANGRAVIEDAVEAYQWVKVAEERGCDGATLTLAMMEGVFLSPEQFQEAERRYDELKLSRQSTNTDE